MKAVIQRVREAEIKVDGQSIGKIDKGYLILVGFCNGDDDQIIEKMVRKILDLRIFEDEAGKMNLNIRDAGGEILSVSQFTLYADCRKGNRPGFTDAARAEDASRMYDRFNELLKEQIHTETGKFQADMKVSLLNDGPFTVILDSEELF